MTHENLPQVDFVLGESGRAEDEDLPQPRRRDFSPLSRFRRPLLALAGVAALVGAVVAVTRPGDDTASTPVAQPSATPTASAPASTTTTLDPATGRVLSDARVTFHLTGCAKDSTSCITSVPADPDLGGIVRAVFPGAHLTTGTMTTRGPQGALIARTVHADDGTQFIAIEIHARAGQIDNPPPAGLTGVAVDNGRYAVFATVVGRSSDSPDPYPALKKLATDPRITH